MPNTKKLDLTSEPFFPSFRQLPYDNDIDDSYYELDHEGIYGPAFNWLYLGEIKEDVSLHPPNGYIGFSLINSAWGIERPRYTVVDREGKAIHVAFHLEDPIDIMTFDRDKFKVGHTLAVLYANSHIFMDGKVGLRIESLISVTVIPCSLASLLKTDINNVPSQTKCRTCGKGGALLACSKCKTKYCSKPCQTKNWKTHKSDCVALFRKSKWSALEWNKFNDFWNADVVL